VIGSRYRLSFPARRSHLIDVEARFPEVGHDRSSVDLRMAAWTPGSYLIRDYARHVQDLAAESETGRRLATTKVDKATWRVSLAGARELVVRYQVYAWELTVRTNHVDESHAFVVGAATYLWLDERRDAPAQLVVEPPPGWRAVVALSGEPDGAGTRFEARDLDELIDSPIHVGPGPVHALEAAGRPLELAVWGRADAGPVGGVAQLVSDLPKIVEAHARTFGGVPYERYAFLLMIAPNAYGGLEHRRSAALLCSAYSFSGRRKYEELLELVSHEFFHLWNVKRIRPRALDPCDYRAEAYTRSLWVAEGVTSYYDRLALRRARLQPIKRYLEKLAEEWGNLLSVPGRHRQSLEEASFDAWIKLYRPDENTANSTVSYYLKGSLVALCLDLEIRRRTGGRRSLDDVMLRLWREYGEPDRSYADGDVQLEAERAVDLDLGAFFDRHVRGREDPDLAGALAALGLTLRPKPEKDKDTDEPRAPAWAGVTTRGEAGSGRLLVATALAGGPAEAAGMCAHDEIVALDGFRVDEKSFADRIGARRPGDRVRVTVFRRDELTDVDLVLGEKPPTWEIVPAEAANEAARALQKAWLGDDGP
jgi:predicted metalloprotease with PDZ domain